MYGKANFFFLSTFLLRNYNLLVFPLFAYFNVLLCDSCLFNALVNAVCLYNTCLFLFVYFAFCIIIYALIYVSMPGILAINI